MQITKHAKERFEQRIKRKIRDYNYGINDFLQDLKKSQFQSLKRVKKGKWKIVTKVVLVPKYGKTRQILVALIVCKKMRWIITLW